LNKTKIKYPGISSLKVLFAGIILFISGLLSSYLYYAFWNYGGIFFPGILYTSSTLILFALCNIPLKIKEISIYYFLMMLTYLVVWLATLLTSWFAFLGGIITAGSGAVVTFMLTNKYIIKFCYDKTTIFIYGGLSFLFIDILGWIFEKGPIEYFFNIEGSVETIFGDVFIIWHLIVGMALTLILKKSEH
jgi:hypothetical protein